MWSVLSFCQLVFDGGDQEAGGESVGAEFHDALMAGRVIMVSMAELMCQAAQRLRVVHAVADGDSGAVGEPRGFRATVVPNHPVAATLCSGYKCVNQ